MQIKLKVDYNEEYQKGSDGAGLPDDLKRKLVKVGLAEKVTSAPARASTATPATAKPKARAKSRAAARSAAPEGHRPLAGPAPEPAVPAAPQTADTAEQ